jgi:small-conductance mechanosensitive channel
MPESLLAAGSAWLRALLVLGGALALGLLARYLLMRLARAVVPRMLNTAAPGTPPGSGPSDADGDAGDLVEPDDLAPLRAPSFVFFPILAFALARFYIKDALTTPWVSVLDSTVYLLLVFAGAWMLVRVLVVIEAVIVRRQSLDAENNLRARKIITQVRIVRRLLATAIAVIAIGIALVRYQEFRDLGSAILASAGIIGIVAGIAAQQTLGNVIAGLQIAFTQPIRMDDVIVVEGEFGWVEEITLTYVVVRVWDLRRIVLPITHFVNKPFQNWTRSSSDLLGTVFLRVDYTVDFDAVREALMRICQASEYWDGKVARLHVTETTEKTVELRALASASSAPRLWELRCEVRERLITFLRDEYPGTLPVVRASLSMPGGDGPPAPPRLGSDAGAPGDLSQSEVSPAREGAAPTPEAASRAEERAPEAPAEDRRARDAAANESPAEDARA